jgi:hypothetical protein
VKPASLLLISILLAASLAAQTNCEEGAGALVPDPPPVSHEELIQKFAANEAVFKQALATYSFLRDISIQTVRRGPFRRVSVTGEYRLVSEMSFDEHGKLLEKVTYAPKSTLNRVQLTREDFDDIRSLADFIFTPSALAQYAVRYAGKQRVDELETYVFNVGPKHLEKNHRYFEGKIWVEAQEFAIVKSCGRRIPDRYDKKYENVSPRYVTYREQIDGRYWFPTYSRSDDVLYFNRSQSQIREIIKYTRYQRVAARTSTDLNR